MNFWEMHIQVLANLNKMLFPKKEFKKSLWIYRPKIRRMDFVSVVPNRPTEEKQTGSKQLDLTSQNTHTSYCLPISVSPSYPGPSH
jgi:hypothetical protein